MGPTQSSFFPSSREYTKTCWQKKSLSKIMFFHLQVVEEVFDNALYELVEFVVEEAVENSEEVEEAMKGVVEEVV